MFSEPFYALYDTFSEPLYALSNTFCDISFRFTVNIISFEVKGPAQLLRIISSSNYSICFFCNQNGECVNLLWICFRTITWLTTFPECQYPLHMSWVNMASLWRRFVNKHKVFQNNIISYILIRRQGSTGLEHQENMKFSNSLNFPVLEFFYSFCMIISDCPVVW
jgi:hypothetical protein